jgi:hypothetical protein
MCQNMGSVGASNVDAVTGAINLAAGYQKGTVTMTVDGLSAAITNGTWVKIGGHAYRIVSTVGGAIPTSITISSGLRTAVADNAVITLSDPFLVNFASGYAVGYDQEITFDGATNLPTAGQAVTFGTSTTSAVYTIVQATSTTIILDRPLEAALSDNDPINPVPAGEYNLAFHRNAIALVTRPLALPMAGAGARAAVVNVNGMSMRVVITYNGTKQGHLVTIDMLCGVKVLDSALGAVLVG